MQHPVFWKPNTPSLHTSKPAALVILFTDFVFPSSIIPIPLSKAYLRRNSTSSTHAQVSFSTILKRLTIPRDLRTRPRDRTPLLKSPAISFRSSIPHRT